MSEVHFEQIDWDDDASVSKAMYQAVAEIGQLRKVLEFYADEDNWTRRRNGKSWDGTPTYSVAVSPHEARVALNSEQGK